MRTNIVIDQSLMNEAQALTGYKTKKETVEKGLELLVRMHKQEAIRKMRGKLKWEGNLDSMRKKL